MVVHHLSTHNTRRHSHDGVAHQHDDCGKHSAEERCRSNVAVSNRRHRHDCPIDAGRDVGERRVRDAAFHYVHQCAHTDDHDDHEEEEDANLRGTDDEGTHQEVALLQEAEELEHAKDTDEAECTHYHKVANRSEYPAYVERQSTQQVNDTEEAKGIIAWFVGAVETTKVLERKEECEDILQHGEDQLCLWRHSLQAFQYDNQYACDNAAK